MQSNPDVTTSGPANEKARVAALVDCIEELVASAAAPVDRARLQEDVRLCSQEDKRLVPLALVFGATASIDRDKVRGFLNRLPERLTPEVADALELVSETILMVSDADLQASGAIASSLLVQRSLPDGTIGRDLVLNALLDLLDGQYQERMGRHSEVFAPLRKVEKSVSIRAVPKYLSEISEALEDVACERDVFLDDPIELVPKSGAPAETTEELFRMERVKSGADLPSLSDETQNIQNLCDALGWTLEQGLSFATELYERKVMDSRAKLGLSCGTIAMVVSDLNGILDSKLRDIQIDDTRGGAAYSYDAEQSTLILYINYGGKLTSNVVRAEHQAILEKEKESEADRAAAILAEAVQRYEKARSAARLSLVPLEEEVASAKALGETLGLSELATYEMMTRLYGAEDLSFSQDPNHGISVEGLRHLVGVLSELGKVTEIVVDAEAPGTAPFSFDAESGTLRLHSAYRRVTDLIVRWLTDERSLTPQPLAEPDEVGLTRYQDPTDPGSLGVEANLERFIDEYQLADDFALDSFEVMFESCPQLRELVSIQTLRVLVQTLTERLGDQGKIDVVTGWSRQIPGTNRQDQDSVAWVNMHEEEGETMRMLTFNFNYGDGKTELPPFSDELLLDWCRHYQVSAIAPAEG